MRIKLGWILSVGYIMVGAAWSMVDTQSFREVEGLYLMGAVPGMVFVLWRTGNSGDIYADENL